MKFAASSLTLFLGLVLLAGPGRSRAQGLQVDVEEIKRLAGQIADLRDANQAQLRKIRDLESQVEALRGALRESNERATTKQADFVTREDLDKFVNSIREVDDKREADKKLILEEIKELGVKLAAPVEPSNSRKRNRRESNDQDKKEDEPAVISGEFYNYPVQKNDAFSKIVSDWNSTLKSKGLPSVSYDEVKRVNPKLNPNLIYEGQKILLPFPADKK
jgi:hypothetical protein